MFIRKITIDKGFTLIELLVVISIIALLLAILIPSLGLAKKHASAIVCMTHVKHLSLGWFMYQQENDGKLMSSRMNGQNRNGEWIPGCINQPYNSEGDLLSSNQKTPAVTDEDEIRGIEDGALYPYLKSPKSYNCPADKVRSIHDGTETYITYAVASGFASDHSENEVYKFGAIRSPSTTFNFPETALQRNYAGGMFV